MPPVNGTKICFWCCPIPISMQAPRHWIEPGMLNSSGVKMHINSIAWCRNKANCWKTIARKKKAICSLTLLFWGEKGGNWKFDEGKCLWIVATQVERAKFFTWEDVQPKGAWPRVDWWWQQTVYNGYNGGWGGGGNVWTSIQEHCSSGFQRQGWKSHAFKCNLSTNN